MTNGKLRRELRAQGSNQYEAEQLLAVAQRLHKLPVPHLDKEAKEAIANQLGLRPHYTPIYNRLALAGGLVAIVLVLTTAWFSGPGSHIYGVKGLTNFFHEKSQPSTGQKLTSPTFTPAQPLVPLPNTQPNATTNSGNASSSTQTQPSNDTNKDSTERGHGRDNIRGYGSNQEGQNQSSNWFNSYDFLFVPNNSNN